MPDGDESHRLRGESVDGEDMFFFDKNLIFCCGSIKVE